MMRRNVICQTMGISFTVFPFRPISARFAQSLLIYALSDSAEGAGGAARGGGGRDRPFQCQFTEIPAVKNEKGESESTSQFLPRSFSLIQLDLSIAYL